MKRRSWLKITLVLGFFVLLLVVLVAGLFSRQLLTVDSGPAQADVLLVLGGGGLERPVRAAELFKAGAAPMVICTGAGDADSHMAALVVAGVPASAVQMESRSFTTRENAEFTIALLHARHLKSAIIVTSWYHSRRALACFEYYGPDLKFYSRPTHPENIWKYPRPHGPIFRVFTEYLKILGYWLCYGISPSPP